MKKSLVLAALVAVVALAACGEKKVAAPAPAPAPVAAPAPAPAVAEAASAAKDAASAATGAASAAGVAVDAAKDAATAAKDAAALLATRLKKLLKLQCLRSNLFAGTRKPPRGGFFMGAYFVQIAFEVNQADSHGEPSFWDAMMMSLALHDKA